MPDPDPKMLVLRSLREALISPADVIILAVSPVILTIEALTDLRDTSTVPIEVFISTIPMWIEKIVALMEFSETFIDPISVLMTASVPLIPSNDAFNEFSEAVTVPMLVTISASPALIEVMVVLKEDSEVCIVPTLVAIIAWPFFTPVGYYLLFSFVMPNDQPGMWWIVGYEFLPITIMTVITQGQTTLTTQGTQLWMQYPSVSSSGNYIIQGGGNFTFSSNVTAIQLYPANPQGSVIVSAQVNSWNFSSNVIRVKFSLYENIGSPNGPTTPPIAFASVTYDVTSVSSTMGSLISQSGYRITLIEGNGAYLMGITSNQMAEITSSINQTLSVPISQLNAAVVAINGDVAEIQTSFGTMTAQLRTINATIESVKNGQAIIATNVGNDFSFPSTD